MRQLLSIAAGVASALYAQQPAFEVASIRVHQGPLHRMMDLKISGSRVTMEGYNIPLLLMEAYHVKNYQVSREGYPHQNEFGDVYYDIGARARGGAAITRDDVRAMLRTLLADRFHLTIRRESKEMPVYALVVASGGPKLKASTESGECSVHVTVVGRNYDDTFAGCTLDPLVDQLGSQLGERPVLDRTGLQGRYDYHFVSVPEFNSRNDGEPGGISGFDAVQRLGLKLEAQRASIEVIAIDRIEKPTEN